MHWEKPLGFWIAFFAFASSNIEFVPSAPRGQPLPLCPCPDGLLAQKPGPVSHSSKEKDGTWRGESAFPLPRGTTCAAVAGWQASSTRARREQAFKWAWLQKTQGPLSRKTGRPQRISFPWDLLALPHPAQPQSIHGDQHP